MNRLLKKGMDNNNLKKIKYPAGQDIGAVTPQEIATSIMAEIIQVSRSDLEEEREVTHERAMEFCKEYNIDKFFETSAKTGHNVEEVFALAAKEMYF